MADRPHVLIVVQNLPVPLDRRVWLECQVLRRAGYDVSVICPKGPGDPGYQLIDGVHVHKYAPAPQADGVLGYLWEFAYSWARTALLSLRVWRRARFHALQACNPPDTYWALARLWKLRGVQFVFDHHDLNPELFLSRFGEPRGLAGRLQYAGLRWLERRTFRTADRVISTNESYRSVARTRGDVPVEHTAVVRSGPDTTAMRPVRPVPELRRGAKHLVVYLGIMGPQDGVDAVLDAAARIVLEQGRTDVRFALLGFGDCLEQLKARSVELGLSEHVEFTGRADPKMIAEYLSTAAVGLSPDAYSPLNDVSTMNKVMEYMAYALPVVTFRLTETMVSLADCGVVVEPGDVTGFADAVVGLLDDPGRRAALGVAARRRAERVLDWRPQAAAYLGVFDDLLGYASAGLPPAPTPTSPPGADRWGHPLVDLTDEAELDRFAARAAD